MAESTTPGPTEPIRLGGLSHVTLPCRGAQEAKRFWVGLFGAEVEVENPRFVELNLSGATLGFAEGSPLIGPRQTEHPHVAFFLDTELLTPLKERLASNGVPTQALWTRGRYAHMYFLDPSANLFEIVCPNYADIDALPRPTANGGALEFTPTELAYNWQG